MADKESKDRLWQKLKDVQDPDLIKAFDGFLHLLILRAEGKLPEAAQVRLDELISLIEEAYLEIRGVPSPGVAPAGSQEVTK
jgi:hypothetical protein